MAENESNDAADHKLPLALKSGRKLSSAYPGNKGSTMPKPIRSMNTERKMTRMDGLRFISFFATKGKFSCDWD